MLKSDASSKYGNENRQPNHFTLGKGAIEECEQKRPTEKDPSKDLLTGCPLRGLTSEEDLRSHHPPKQDRGNTNKCGPLILRL
jgi:hypothetical protein